MEGREADLSPSLTPPSLPPTLSLLLRADNDDDDDEGNLCESVQLSRVRAQRGRFDARRRDPGQVPLPSGWDAL